MMKCQERPSPLRYFQPQEHETTIGRMRHIRSFIPSFYGPKRRQLPQLNKHKHLLTEDSFSSIGGHRHSADIIPPLSTCACLSHRVLKSNYFISIFAKPSRWLVTGMSKSIGHTKVSNFPGGVSLKQRNPTKYEI